MVLFSARTDAIIDCVIDALHDPLRPKYCARFYVDAIVSIENTDDDYADKEERKGRLISSSLHRRVRRHRHDLLDALWRFLTVLRSVDAIITLGDGMRECRCYEGQLSRTWKWMHAPQGRDLFLRDAYMVIIEFMGHVLRLAPDAYWKSERRAARAIARGSIPRWPAHVRTLLGPDPDATMTALSRWTAAYQGPVAHFELLAEVSRICGRAAAIVMLRCTHLPRALADVVERNLPMLEKGLTVNKLRYVMPCLRWWHLTFRYPDGMSTAYFCGDQGVRIVGLMDRLTRLWPRVERLPGIVREELRPYVMFILEAGTIHSSLDLPYDEGVYHPDVLSRSRSIRRLREEDDIYIDMHLFMRSQRKVDFCGFPPCMSTFCGEGRRFKYCSGCKRFPYCSVDCQRKHWHWERSPHKDLCADLRYLAEKLEYPSVTSNEERHPDFEDDDVPALCQKKNVDLEAVRRVAKYDQEERSIQREVYGGSADATSYVNLLT
ncbi:hypothetical protein K523DRAFT_370589 [Schizophyllum commune Tattone D]|nr:hypothetical protein K523DRAFT_370589 [Schizophyllum commune Tattone D]